MTLPKARLAVSAILFVGWLGFLLYLVVDSRIVILSKPQFLVAQVIVVVDIGDGPGAIVVEEVLWSADPANKRLVKEQIKVAKIADIGPKQGFDGPGKYLLPLIKAAGAFQIAPLPAQTPEIRVYPWSPRLRGQVDEIVKMRK